MMRQAKAGLSVNLNAVTEDLRFRGLSAGALYRDCLGEGGDPAEVMVWRILVTPLPALPGRTRPWTVSCVRP